MNNLPRSAIEQKRQTKDFSPEELDIIMADPAAYAVYCLVTAGVRETASELIAYISERNPDLTSSVTRVLSILQSVGIIDVVGDRIFLSKLKPEVFLAPGTTAVFLPEIAFALSRSVLEKRAKQASGYTPDSIQCFPFPDHPTVQRKLKTLHENYIHELEKLADWVANQDDLKANDVRVSFSILGNIPTEDL